MSRCLYRFLIIVLSFLLVASLHLAVENRVAHAQYSVTVSAWDNVHGSADVNITKDGLPTGFSTPHTFTDLSGTHTFTVPSIDSFGNPFKNWTTGGTSRTITVNSGGTYTAQYYTYSARIWAWNNNASRWVNVSIIMDGVDSGFLTPHVFEGLSGVHTFSASSIDSYGDPFRRWVPDGTNQTITVSSDGTHTAQYYHTPPVPDFTLVTNSTSCILTEAINLTGTLSVPESGIVTLDWAINASGFVYHSNESLVNGVFSRLFGFGQAGTWQFRVNWPGTLTSNPTTSNSVTVAVASDAIPEFPSVLFMMLMMMPMVAGALFFRRKFLATRK